jgi:hypothetical protein
MNAEQKNFILQKKFVWNKHKKFFLDLKKRKDLWIQSYCLPRENKDKGNDRVLHYFMIFPCQRISHINYLIEYKEWVKVFKFLLKKEGTNSAFLAGIREHLHKRYTKYMETRKEIMVN